MSNNPVWNDELNETNSLIYTAKAKPKFAILSWQGADYKLSWGKQSFDGPHMVIGAEGGGLGLGEYGCELEAFFTTHEPLADVNWWRKCARVRAHKVKVDTDLVTVVKGQEESRSTVLAGGWIIQNPGGEQYYNTPNEFVERYELV